MATKKRRTIVRHDRAYMYASVKKWLKSGKSRKAFSKELGIHYKSFCNWIVGYAKSEGITVKALLEQHGLPTRSTTISSIPESQESSSPERFIPVAVSSPPSTGVFMEFTFPNGVELRFYQPVSAEYIQELMQLC